MLDTQRYPSKQLVWLQALDEIALSPHLQALMVENDEKSGVKLGIYFGKSVHPSHPKIQKLLSEKQK